ncbi:MAG: alanyl-tRNA editing protein [Theionarchaea archaeon]|nr:alanyl-tRNA editing protein [Theionarchaea archaeon]MBU7038042.1 alanyl-tRNA editing protein [Theionarchaea archaeon]
MTEANPPYEIKRNLYNGRLPLEGGDTMWKYYLDPYLRELKTAVKKVDDNQVILEDTIFYPTGGGQPHDRGTISNQEIQDVFELGSDVVHVLDQAPFLQGNTVRCLLDWDYRYAVMRMHSALHLLFDVAGELFGISASAGSNVEAEKSRLDLVYDDVLDEPKRAALEKRFSALIDEDRPITAWWEGNKRLVQIEGYDPMPCGGLHTKSTQEIGYLSKLKRKNVGKGKERVEVFL